MWVCEKTSQPPQVEQCLPQNTEIQTSRPYDSHSTLEMKCLKMIRLKWICEFGTRVLIQKHFEQSLACREKWQPQHDTGRMPQGLQIRGCLMFLETSVEILCQSSEPALLPPEFQIWSFQNCCFLSPLCGALCQKAQEVSTPPFLPSLLFKWV